MPKDACYHKVKARYKVFPSAYASGAIAKCRKVGAANYGTGGKKKKKKADGGYETTMSDQGIENPKNKLGKAKSQLLRGLRDKEQSMKAKEGKVVRMTKRKSKNPNIARGCGAIMSSKRKKTKYA